MNSFKKYPKLSYLFIVRLGLILFYFGFVFYCKKEISNNLNLLRTARFEGIDSSINKELMFLFNLKLDRYENQINSNIDLLIGGTIIFVLSIILVDSLAKKENKHLDLIENEA